MTEPCHWDMGDEIACDNVKGDMSRVASTSTIIWVTCPDCLVIYDAIASGFRAYADGNYQDISELWKDINDDNE